MCRAATCSTCQKTTWAGCGQHISQVKRTVPASQWCNGKHSQAEIEAAKANRTGFFSKLFQR